MGAATNRRVHGMAALASKILVRFSFSLPTDNHRITKHSTVSLTPIRDIYVDCFIL
jgi:hypothetical protein